MIWPWYMAESCGRLSALTGLSGWTMMAMASRATTNSTGSMPAASRLARSCAEMAREALAMSTVPFSSAANPVPEPPPVTDTLIAGYSAW